MKGFNKKKLWVLIVTFVLFSLLFGAPVYANDANGDKIIDQANAKIDNAIDRAVFLAGLEPATNTDQIVDNLLSFTNKTVTQTELILGQDLNTYYVEVLGAQVDPIVCY